MLHLPQNKKNAPRPLTSKNFFSGINMVVVDGYKYAEVAECLNSKVEIVKTILYRAKQKLKMYLTETEKRKESKS